MSACSDEVSSHYARCPSPVSLIEYPFRILDLVPTQNSGRNPIYLTSSYCARTTIQDSCIVTDERTGKGHKTDALAPFGESLSRVTCHISCIMV